MRHLGYRYLGDEISSVIALGMELIEKKLMHFAIKSKCCYF